MDHERAETYLRALAEAELRRAIAQLSGNAPRAGDTARLKKVAQVLVFVGALDDGVAEQILDQFELALGARQGVRSAWFWSRSAGELRSAASWRDGPASGPLRLVCQRLALVPG